MLSTLTITKVGMSSGALGLSISHRFLQDGVSRTVHGCGRPHFGYERVIARSICQTSSGAKASAAKRAMRADPDIHTVA